MGPKFRFGLYSQGENGDQVMHYEGMKAEKSCNKLQLFDCSYIQKQEIDVVKTNPSDPDDSNQIVGQYETNDDQGKRDRIINTLINKITKDIIKKSKSNKDDIKKWATTEVNKLDWDKDLDKSKDRKKKRDQLTKKGKKIFKQENGAKLPQWSGLYTPNSLYCIFFFSKTIFDLDYIK